MGAVLRIYTYIVATDAGFAPNPFYGFCTLACCKPAIRRSASPDDWLVGITPARRGPRAIVYAMQVEEVLPFSAYWADRRFERKKPKRKSAAVVERCGDNCLAPIRGGGFRQVHCAHSREDGSEDPAQAAHDLGGRNVLVSRAFTYFGQDAMTIPDSLVDFMVPGRGHKVNFTVAQTQALLRFLVQLPRGIRGPPSVWPAVDESWKEGRLRCG